MVVKKTSDPFKLRNYGNVMVKDVYTNVCLCDDERTVQHCFTNNVLYCLTYNGSHIPGLHIAQDTLVPSLLFGS